MPGLNAKQEDIDNFVAITQATPAEAERFLADGVTLEGAIEDFFAAQTAGGAPAAAAGAEAEDEDELDAALAASMGDSAPAPAAAPSGGQTMGGGAAEALPAGWGAPRRAGGMATLDSLNREASPDEDDPRRRNELYTGGERSGLAVQGPPGQGEGGRGLVSDILQQARDAGPGIDLDAPPPPRNPWGGVGNTLGSEDTPSVQVGGRAPRAQRVPGAFGGEAGDDEDEEDDEGSGETVQRRVTFWRDGFSIEDGELYRYDVPANQELLQMIHAGRAPLSLFNVRYDQPLQLVIDQKTEEDYKPPPKAPMKAFEGGGNRLGSADDVPSTSAAAAAPAAAAPAATASAPEIKVDASKPSTSIQLRMGDGSRLVVKVNLDHTVADLRAHVANSRPDPRPFVLQTTFPSRELPDAETVEEAKLQNAVVVQRFT